MGEGRGKGGEKEGRGKEGEEKIEEKGILWKREVMGERG